MNLEYFQGSDVVTFAHDLVAGLTDDYLIKDKYTATPNDSRLSDSAPRSGKYTLKASQSIEQGQLVFHFGLSYADPIITCTIQCDHVVVNGEVVMAPETYKVIAYGTNTGEDICNIAKLTPEKVEGLVSLLNPKHQSPFARAIDLFDECEKQLSNKIKEEDVIPLNFELTDKTVSGVTKELMEALTVGGELQPSALTSFNKAQVRASAKFLHDGSFQLSVTCFDDVLNAYTTQFSKHKVINGTPLIQKNGYGLEFKAPLGGGKASRLVGNNNKNELAYRTVYGEYPKACLRSAVIVSQLLERLEIALKHEFES